MAYKWNAKQALEWLWLHRRLWLIIAIYLLMVAAAVWLAVR